MTVFYAKCKFGPLYKNVYCALCNVPEKILPYDCEGMTDADFKDLLESMQYKPVLGYFSALLNFGTIDAIEHFQIDEKCLDHMVYSPILVSH
jgi:hypothetical protein